MERLCRHESRVYEVCSLPRPGGFGPTEKGLEEFLIAVGVAGSEGVVMLRRIESRRDMEIVTRNLDILNHSTFVWW